MRPEHEMSAWAPDDPPRRMPWGTILAGASLAALATALVLLSPRAPAQQPVTLVALICAYDAESDRYVKDCGPFEDAAADLADCKAMAAWLRQTAPAGLRVVHHECFKAKPRAVEVAKR